ncbi:hypothetical protein D9C73_024113 [Collichthys lucidus]|uniref:Uncharacterized protein n=1 Tax=Collichthys lucidus TaxID=240159 RepID=A0A4U5VND3_COLLU|nr:hypothetical protein D9C73_024113 [Collichthys lucidus]
MNSVHLRSILKGHSLTEDMNILIAFAVSYYMATFARSAPLPGVDTLVADPQSQEIVESSRLLLQKILLSIPDTHKSCIHSEGLKLNSSENAKLVIMAATIGIPSAPVLRPVSENFSVQASDSPHLDKNDKLTELMADIRDLVIKTNKLLKIVQRETVGLPTPTPVTLNLPGEYEVQVAAHLILVQLQSFGQDVDRSLRSLIQNKEEDTEI